MKSPGMHSFKNSEIACDHIKTRDLNAFQHLIWLQQQLWGQTAGAKVFLNGGFRSGTNYSFFVSHDLVDLQRLLMPRLGLSHITVDCV